MTNKPMIKELKEKLNWTNEQIAKLAGASPRTVENWLQGRNRTPLSVLHLMNMEVKKHG